MRQKNIKFFKGLQLQRNSFSEDDGYLEKANNIIIQYDGLIQKFKGYKTFYDPSPVIPLNLFDYNSTLFQVSTSKVTRLNQDANGDFVSATDLPGTIRVVDIPPRAVSSNGNLYFTTDSGVRKLESTTATILSSGVDKAPDLTYLPLGSGTTNDPNAGIHLADAQIGYRVVFGRKDANLNLVLGAPSEFAIGQNTLFASDNVSLSTYDVTVTFAAGHGLSVNDFVTIRNSNGSNPVPNGEYVITAVTGTTFTFSTITVLASAPSGVSVLDFGIRRKPQLQFTVPDGVNTTDFIYQVYRTNNSASIDVEPDESTLQQVFEANLTSSDLSNHYVLYTDIVDDLFKQSYLYTNPNTGEGILQENDLAPLCRDMAIFRNHAFYANITYNYLFDINLIRASSTTFVNGDSIDIITTSDNHATTSAIWQSGTTVRYAMANTTDFEVNMYVCITGFVNANNNGKYIITSISPGAYIEVTNANRTNSTGNETGVSALTRKIRRYTAGSSEVFDTPGGAQFKLVNNSSTAVNIDSTARSLVRVINRDTRSDIYAYYTSSSLSLPGQMFVRGRNISDNVAFQASTATVGDNFDPTLPTAFGDLTKTGTQTAYPNGLAISKVSQPEAVPNANFVLVGSKEKAILRIIALRDSLIVIKQDGVYRLIGDSVSNFIVVALDNTVFCKAENSVALLQNTVFMVSNQGVVRVYDNSVAIVSRDIEPVITSVLGDTEFAQSTFGTGIESDRLYQLTTIDPNTPTGFNTYIYNILTGTWTTTDKLFQRGVVKFLDDTLYTIDFDNILKKNRRSNTKLDFTDEQSAVTVVSVSSDKLSAVLTTVGLVFEVDDVVVFNNTLFTITSVNGNTIGFRNPVTFAASASGVVLYKHIESEFITAPITAGEASTMKRFADMQVNLRNRNCSKLSVGFFSDYIETGFYDWSTVDTFGQGWGLSPWGFAPWGDSNLINITYETAPTQPVRSFLPALVVRSSWLKIKIRHKVAAELMNIQNIEVGYEAYSTRVSR